MTVYVANPAVFPWTAVVHIVTTFSDGSQSSGSGAVVGPNDVLTAAHVVYEAGLRATRVEVIPAQNGASEPFGRSFPVSWDYYPVDTDGDGLMTADEAAYDFAVLAFDFRLAATTGSFGWTWVATATANLTGYPGKYGGNRMTNDIGPVRYDDDFGIVDISRLEVNPGNSGGPVWIAGNQVIGVVSTGSWAAAVGGPYWNTVVGWMGANNALIGSTAPPPPDTPTEGADTLGGSAGSDSIDGRGGGDRISGGAGDDALFGGSGADTLDGGDDGDSLYGGSDADTLRGDAGDDWLYGGDGSDSLNGGSGDDWLDGDAGNDILAGSIGSDTFAIFATQGGDTITDFFSGLDVIRIGSADPDWDYSRLRLLASQFHAAAGAASAVDDDDFVIYDTASGDLYYDPDGNRAAPAEWLARLSDAPVLAVGDIWIPVPINLSTAGPDRLIGSAAAETLDAGGGDDAVEGRGGDDHLLGGGGDDALAGGSGFDTLDGGAGNDNLDGGPDDDLLRGGDGDDLLYGDTGLDSIDGGAGSDTVVYFFASNRYFVLRDADGRFAIGFENLVGSEPLSGIEKIRFGGIAGDDLLLAALAANVGDDGRDLFFGRDADDTLDGLAGNDRLDGGGGDDQLSGSDGNDALFGGAGDDRLDGGSGADRMFGGAGDDAYFIDNALDVVGELALAGVDTVTTTLGVGNLATMGAVDNLIFAGSGRFVGSGNGLANRIVGGDDADRLGGGGGDDRLETGAGNDTVNGGAGVDTAILPGLREDYVFTRPGGTTVGVLRRDGAESRQFNGIEWVAFADGSIAALSRDDLLVNTASIVADRYLGGAGDDSFDGLAGDDLIAGGDGRDTLIGGAGNDTIDGGGGIDTLLGGPGNDIYVVGEGADLILELPGEGLDRVRATLPAWTLGTAFEQLEYVGSAAFAGRGNALANRIAGGAGDDFLAGGDGSDRLVGGAGNDTLDGGRGADRLDGDLGDDTYVIDSAGDVIVADPGGSDTVLASVGWTLAGGIENLALSGGAAIAGIGNALANRLVGNAAANTLRGGGGDDTLNGGGGRDLLAGGSGADRFVFDELPAFASGADVISDFLVGVDELALDGEVFAGLVWDGGGALAAGQLVQGPGVRSAQDADDRLIYDSRTGALFYDADGDGAAVLFAILGAVSHPRLLDAADFVAA